MKTNVKKTEVTPGILTHEGAAAVKDSPERELTRAVSACLLFEDTFYEKGSDLAKRIDDLCSKVDVPFVLRLAWKARTELHLRHVPLYLCVQMLKARGSTPIIRNEIGETIAAVIQRADELAEILAIYWKVNGKDASVPRQLKAGIAKAFRKFDEYQLAKYNRDGEVKLRDALFLSHAKPENKKQAALWKKLVDGKLKPPDTWEVQLSAGKDKKKTFERLIKAKKLGHLAILRNLRKMEEVDCDRELIAEALERTAQASRVLPFRYVAAAKHAPWMEEALGRAMIASTEKLPKLTGRTLLVVDISGSMHSGLGGKTEMNRIDAAGALAILVREQAEDATIYATAGNDGTRIHKTELVPPRRAFALSDAVHGLYKKLGGGGIFLVQCMDYIAEHEKKAFDRVIVFTDEQDCDLRQKASIAKKLGKRNYIVNVATYEPSLPVIGAGWTRICGFSERVVDWLIEDEKTQ